jgi:hypothetical protein
VATTVWGWKVWLLFCPLSGLPIAHYVDRNNADDRVWMLALVLQGQANLGGRLQTVSFDRGFWDGQTLYAVAQHVPFFIPGKADLEITQEARRAAGAVYAPPAGAAGRGRGGGHRAVTVVRGRGDASARERQAGPRHRAPSAGLPHLRRGAASPKIHEVLRPRPTECRGGGRGSCLPHADPDEPLVVLTLCRWRAPGRLAAYDRFERGVSRTRPQAGQAGVDARGAAGEE